MHSLARVLAFLGLLACLNAQTLRCRASTSDYDCMASVDDNYTLHWRLRRIELYVRIEVRTRGWIGLCFPHKPRQMAPADSVIGWVDAEGTHVDPYYITERAVSAENVNKNVTLRNIAGSESKGRIVIEFCIRLGQLRERVDPQQVVHINYAYGDEDRLVYHGPRRGSATIRFADVPEEDAPPPPSPPRDG